MVKKLWTDNSFRGAFYGAAFTLAGVIAKAVYDSYQHDPVEEEWREVQKLLGQVVVAYLDGGNEAFVRHIIVDSGCDEPTARIHLARFEAEFPTVVAYRQKILQSARRQDDRLS